MISSIPSSQEPLPPAAHVPASLRTWLEKSVQKPMSAVGLLDLLSSMDIRVQAGARITKEDLVRASQLLAYCDFEIEPDPRFAYPAPISLSEVIVFHALGDGAFEPIKPDFTSLLAHIDVALIVATGEGVVIASRLHDLEEAVRISPGLTIGERRRLIARLVLLSRNPPAPNLLAHLRDRPLRETARVALAVATSNGVISVDSLRLLERIYAILSLPVSTAIFALNIEPVGSASHV